MEGLVYTIGALRARSQVPQVPQVQKGLQIQNPPICIDQTYTFIDHLPQITSEIAREEQKNLEKLLAQLVF